MPDPNLVQTEIKRESLEYLLNQFKLNFFNYAYSHNMLKFTKLEIRKVFNIIPIKTYISLSREESERKYNEIGFDEILNSPSIIDVHYYNLYHSYEILLKSNSNPVLPIFLGNLILLLTIANVLPEDLEKYSCKRD